MLLREDNFTTGQKGMQFFVIDWRRPFSPTFKKGSCHALTIFQKKTAIMGSGKIGVQDARLIQDMTVKIMEQTHYCFLYLTQGKTLKRAPMMHTLCLRR